MDGIIDGERVRKRSHDMSALVRIKAEKETAFLAKRGQLEGIPQLSYTWLAPDDLRGAESLRKAFPKATWDDMAQACRDYLARPEAPSPAVAMLRWLRHLKSTHRFPVTVASNRRRIAAFLRSCGAYRDWKLITPLAVETWMLDPKLSPSAQASRGRPLKAWLRYCWRKEWIARVPIAMDLTDLAQKKAAEDFVPPSILTPEQCEALVRAAEQDSGGKLMPYVALCLFCFMRSQEVMRPERFKLRLDGPKPLIEVWPVKRGVRYRTVEVPENALPFVKAPVWFSRKAWARVREKAGLIKRAKARGGKYRKILSSCWDPNLLRHTGLSYFYQRTGDIKETCRQAGNSTDIAFRHYLALPKDGDSAKFYAIKPSASTQRKRCMGEQISLSCQVPC